MNQNAVRRTTFCLIYRDLVDQRQKASGRPVFWSAQNRASCLENSLEIGGAENITLTVTVRLAMAKLGIGDSRESLDAYLSGSDHYA